MTKIGELVTPTGVLVIPPNASREEWLEARRMRANVPGKYVIGASDVASILDLDGVDTPVHVFKQKREGYRTPQNEAMIFGHVLEEPVAAEWCRRNRAVIDEIGFVAHVDRPWLGATIDRRVRECPMTGERDNCGAEVKCVSFMSATQWRDDLPDRIIAQVCFQLFVTGYSHMHVAMLIGGNQLRQTVVRADKERALIDYIVAEVEAFRSNHLIPGIEPPWNTGKADKLLALDKALHPERIGEIGVDEIGDVLDYAEASAEAGAAEKRRKAAAARLAQIAGGRQVVTFAGERAFWYGESEDVRANLDVLAERYPDAYADPEVVTRKKKYTVYIDKAYKVRQT